MTWQIDKNNKNRNISWIFERALFWWTSLKRSSRCPELYDVVGVVSRYKMIDEEGDTKKKRYKKLKESGSERVDKICRRRFRLRMNVNVFVLVFLFHSWVPSSLADSVFNFTDLITAHHQDRTCSHQPPKPEEVGNSYSFAKSLNLTDQFSNLFESS